MAQSGKPGASVAAMSPIPLDLSLVISTFALQCHLELPHVISNEVRDLQKGTLYLSKEGGFSLRFEMTVGARNDSGGSK